MARPLLSVANLTVERGGRIVLSDLSFDIDAGGIVLVSGPNGTGKSTLLRTVAGLLKPTSGQIEYGLSTDEVCGIETAHYLGYDDALKPSLTVGENLTFWASLLSASSVLERSPALSVDQALSAYGIGRLVDLRAGYLSAGQKRRVALARLLLAPRPIWLLDEPLIALDQEAQATLTNVMAAHVANGGGILVASHQPLALAHYDIDLAVQVVESLPEPA